MVKEKLNDEPLSTSRGVIDYLPVQCPSLRDRGGPLDAFYPKDTVCILPAFCVAGAGTGRFHSVASATAQR